MLLVVSPPPVTHAPGLCGNRSERIFMAGAGLLIRPHACLQGDTDESARAKFRQVQSEQPTGLQRNALKSPRL